MEVEMILEELRQKARREPEFLQEILRTASEASPVAAFCALSTRAGWPLYEMDLIEAGEAQYAAMKRSTNGGGENSPLLEWQDDYYEMFMAEMRCLNRAGSPENARK